MRDPGQGVTGIVEQLHVGWLMSEAVRSAQTAVEEAAQDLGVTTSASAVLFVLGQHPGLSGSDLIRQMGRAALPIQVTATYRAMARRERRGLIERKADPHHARISRAALTEDGEQLAERCAATWQRLQQVAFTTFDAGEREILTGLLERYLEALAAID